MKRRERNLVFSSAAAEDVVAEGSRQESQKEEVAEACWPRPVKNCARRSSFIGRLPGLLGHPNFSLDSLDDWTSICPRLAGRVDFHLSTAGWTRGFPFVHGGLDAWIFICPRRAGRVDFHLSTAGWTRGFPFVHGGQDFQTSKPSIWIFPRSPLVPRLSAVCSAP